ncbi:DUF1289 domain-containing protein [Zwartia sp.]|uniref:DUF1289 domain-containing protein n=1 Tax=Zwartia sp. TaxID=2978004 RepID=UPI002725BB4F|nr:DUF1289 domain-containing protein [Zwartia sp.]MDO9025702.1 DUF1289 domain-containing protein [Zwartia sp.]
MTTQPPSLNWDDASDDAAKPAPDDASNGADSPCVAICSTLFDDVCRGCGRTVMEVSNWVFMDAEEKQAVWVRIRAEGYPRKPGET